MFKEGIGTLKHMKTKKIVAENVRAKFHKARPVPYGICSKVDTELEHLEKEGILSKVAWSKWETPIIPAVKKVV